MLHLRQQRKKTVHLSSCAHAFVRTESKGFNKMVCGNVCGNVLGGPTSISPGKAWHSDWFWSHWQLRFSEQLLQLASLLHTCSFRTGHSVKFLTFCSKRGENRKDRRTVNTSFTFKIDQEGLNCWKYIFQLMFVLWCNWWNYNVQHADSRRAVCRLPK